MKARVEIRPMAAADLDQVLALADALPEAPHWLRSAYLKAIDAQSTPRRIALVAAAMGPSAIAGFAVASLLTPQAELETIVVTKSSQRQGIGKQLLQGLIAELKAEGVDELSLEVRASNRSALAFYLSFGLVQTGLRTSYYAEPVEDAILMRLSLA